MKRTRRYILAIAFGALFSLAIAWACALWSPVAPTGSWSADYLNSYARGGSNSPRWMDRWERKNPYLIVARYTEDSGLGLDIAFEVEYEREGGFERTYEMLYWRAGWPLAAFEGAVTRDFATEVEVVVRAAVRAPTGLLPDDRQLLNGSSYLPLRPIPLGLLVDTLMYAAIPLLCVYLVGVVRRRRSSMKGCCPSCRYDRTGLTPIAPCPECGTTPAARPQ